MRKTTHRLLRYLLALGLSLSCAATLAVPRAAEHEDADVTFGGAVGAPPKVTTQPPNKGNKAAGQPVAKEAGQPTGKKSGSAKPARAASSSTSKAPQPTKAAEKAKPKGKEGKK